MPVNPNAPKVSWSEIAKGYFQRPIGENEQLVKIVGDTGAPIRREHWAINTEVSFRHTASTSQEQFIAQLKDAWQTLRFHHPAIAAIAGAQYIGYTKGVSPADVAAGHQPTPYAILHYFPEKSKILLHSSHWRLDGIGVMQLLDHLLQLAGSEKPLPDPSDLAWGEEPSRLTIAAEDATGSPREATEGIKAVASKYVKSSVEATGGVGVECLAAKETVPAGTRTVGFAFSKTNTKAIIAACKTRQISVTSAVHASIAATNWAFAPSDGKSRHYTSTIRIGLRPYLPEPYCTSAYAAANYSTGYSVALQAGKGFETNSQAVNKMYRAGLSDDFLHVLRQYFINIQKLVKQTPPWEDSPPLSSDVDISSIGVLDGKLLAHRHGNIEIESVMLQTEVLTRQMGCFVWTFRGKLNLNLAYNEAFYGRDVPENFLEKLKGTLLGELGVKE
ncbi:Hypothetical predicted protein [Lecanosticta acicola]|uniref:Uncharacterized protein n=1 Tax=Lecanosticta acicola TaxID=111012 RepID=A0AAI9EAQ6_9PEZI|nr:Hypothetical predicted protein [Lecanosticta acicola]